MSFTRRLQATFVAVRYAIFPAPKSSVTRILPTETINLESIKPLLSRLDDQLLPDGTLRFQLSDALPITAPFLLYRLKSDGFSACRATVADNGILITAQR